MTVEENNDHKIKEKAKRWYQENKEKMSDYRKNYQREYRKTNLGKLRLRDKELAKKREQPGYKEKRKITSRIERLKVFGITPDEYDVIFIYQNGCCAICGRPPSGRRLDVDHEHQKNEKKISGPQRKPKIRGLLCHRCNRALGLLSNNTEQLLINAVRLVQYCEKYLRGDIENILS